MRRVLRTLAVMAAVIGVFAALSRRRPGSDTTDGTADGSSHGAIRAGSFDSWPPVPRAPERGSIAG